MPGDSFFSELRKRKVFQAAAIYGAVAWGLTEVVVTVVDQLFLPRWVSTLTVIVFVVGFPIAMFLSWTFDFTAEGIRRTAVSSRRGRASILGSMVLLVAATAGLFFLIEPSLDRAESAASTPEAPPNSIAVLPFANAGRNADDAYLSEGLSDALRDELGQVAGLRVAARSSSVAVRDRSTDARTSAAQLGVSKLVEGNLRRQGQLLQVSVQLVDGESGLALWTERYERGPNELLSVQQEILQRVVAALLPDSAYVPVSPATSDADANELMLLARYQEQQLRSREQVDTGLLLKAIELYRRATERDPQSALAHSRLAAALIYLGDLEAAEAPIFRALSLDPGLSEVQYTRGLYLFARGDPEAMPALRRAVELNPNNADALETYAYALWLQRYDDEAESLFRRALELDPLSLPRHGSLGELLGKQGKSGEVYALIGRIDELFEGPEAMRVVSRLYELTGDLDRAIAWGQRAREAEPDDRDHAEWLAELYAQLGDEAAVLDLTPQPGIGLLYLMRRYDEMIDLAEERMIDAPEDIEARYLLAAGYNATGRYESAVWILGSTGQPGRVMELPRLGADWEGFYTLVNAVDGSGDHDLARNLASWYVDEERHPENDDWFVETYMACMLALVGRQDEARRKIDLVKRSPRLPPRAVLEDLPCFERLAETPEYRSTLEHFAERRHALRQRLPVTLAETRAGWE